MDKPKFLDHDWWKKNKPKSIAGANVDTLLKELHGKSADKVQLVKIYEHSGDLAAAGKVNETIEALGKLSTELKRVSVAALKDKHAEFAKCCEQLSTMAADDRTAVAKALAAADVVVRAKGGGENVTATNLRTAEKVLKDFATTEKALLGDVKAAVAKTAAAGQRASTDGQYQSAFGEFKYLTKWLNAKIVGANSDVRNLQGEIDAAAQGDADFAKGVKSGLAVDALKVTIDEWTGLKDAVEKMDKAVLAAAAKARGKEAASRLYLEALEVAVTLKPPNATGVSLKFKKKT